jgi:MFS family permease
MLTDRVSSTLLLATSVVLWSATLVVSGASGSFAMLLFSRMALGALGATSGPTIASLIGDYFRRRSRPLLRLCPDRRPRRCSPLGSGSRVSTSEFAIQAMVPVACLSAGRGRCSPRD